MPVPEKPKLCWSTNVIEFNFEEEAHGDSAILGSKNTFHLATPYRNGWVNLAFEQSTDNGNSYPDGATQIYKGLPVTGFVLQKYTNRNAQPALLAQYGAIFKQKGKRSITNL